MINEELKKYITTERQKKTSDADIKTKLLQTGWNEGEINSILTPINTPNDGVPIPPRVEHFGMWVGFLYVIFFISLYVFATSVSAIMHLSVDKNIPDAIDSVTNAYLDSSWFVNLYISAIIVSYPIFAVLLYILGKQAVQKPQVRHLRTRKLFIYITLVVTFLIMIGHLIGTIYGFLNSGMVTARILAHLFVTFVVAGSIFGTLLYIVRDDKKTV